MKNPFKFGHKSLDLSYCHVMGILNITPDSFSDGGNLSSLDKVLFQADEMQKQGVSILDVGGESTRPGAAIVSLDEELARVIPVVEALNKRFELVISVDTNKPEVMKAAAAAGANLINDVYALQKENAVAVAAETKLPVCLMHMQGEPTTMQRSPSYKHVVEDIVQFFTSRIDACVTGGIPQEQIILDPGFGFGKTLAHNYQVLGEIEEFQTLKCPILTGTSRKSMLGNLLNREVNERLSGSLASAVVCAMKGARIVRVHDTKETVDAIKVVNAAINGVLSE